MRSNYDKFEFWQENMSFKLLLFVLYQGCYIDLILHSDRNWNARSDSCAELFWACKMVWCSIKSPSIHLFILCCTVNLISHYMIWILIYMGFKTEKQNTYLQQYSPWPLVSLGEWSLRERNAPVSVRYRSLHNSSGQKVTLLLLCVFMVLSPVRTWSIIWTLRSYFLAADYWDNHVNSSLGAVQEQYCAHYAVPLLQRLPALAGVAAAGAGALAFGVNTQLHAVKLCSPLECKLRHRLVQQVWLNHFFTFLPQLSGLVYRLRVVILPSALKSDVRAPDLDLFCVTIFKLACSFNGCRQDSAKHRHSETDI